MAYHKAASSSLEGKQLGKLSEILYFIQWSIFILFTFFPPILFFKFDVVNLTTPTLLRENFKKGNKLVEKS